MGANCSTNSLELATVANGGKLANASGFDFIFTSDNAGLHAIAYERAIQNVTTGAAELWVRIASLSSSADTKIYLFYHNPTVSTDQSSHANVWDGNYVAVHHLSTLTGTYVTAPDSTGNGNNLASRLSAALPVGTNGVVGGGANFSGTAAFDCNTPTCSAAGGFPSAAPFTLEGWFNVNGQSTVGGAYCIGANTQGERWEVWWSGSDWAIEGTNVVVSFPGVARTGWHRIVTVLPSGQTTYIGAKVYVDGVSQTLVNNLNGGTTVNIVNGGSDSYNVSGLCGTLFLTSSFTGLEDEIRISKTERSQDWVTTDYNNESNPGMFYAVGSEVSFIPVGGGPRAIIFK
jgi:uncharacterized RmlC-like cupin family protein